MHFEIPISLPRSFKMLHVSQFLCHLMNQLEMNFCYSFEWAYHYDNNENEDNYDVDDNSNVPLPPIQKGYQYRNEFA